MTNGLWMLIGVEQAAPLESFIFMYVGRTGMLHVKCPSKNRITGWMKLEESFLASFYCSCKGGFSLMIYMVQQFRIKRQV